MLAKIVAMKNAYLKDESGATAIEYALLAAGISLLIIGTVFLLGGDLNVMFETIRTEISGAG